MSASHAEAGHGHEEHGHAEHGHDNESAIETLSDGISKIIKSVGIAVKKVYNGVIGFVKDVFGGLFKGSDHGHGQGEAHGSSHDAHGGGHDAHPPAAAAHH